MAQETHVVDLRRSFIPIDPNAFPATYHGTDAEDKPEGRVPVIPYDGYNFMPTPQGYSSFFGINSTFGIDAIAANVDEIFTIQTNTFNNIAVALTDTGIWTKALNASGAWIQEVVLAAPAVGVHKQWSKCMIDQVLYVYRQGEASVWKCSAATGYLFVAFTPSFITMAGQLGIFKAGGRLAFWDSENSIAWSALGDTAVFTPSTQTLAGNTIFQDIVGKIVLCLQHGDGFIVYCTRSIVVVVRNTSSPFLFQGKAIFTNNGISYRTEVAAGDPDTQHFAISTNGFIEIDASGQAAYSMPEISTYLKEKRQPIALKLINGRYLFFQMLDEAYFTGRVSFATETISAYTYDFKMADAALDDFDGTQSPCRALLASMVNFTSLYLYRQYGFTAFTQATTSASVPIWQDNLVTVIPLANIEGFKTQYLAHTPLAYFNTFNAGGITRLDGSTHYTLPSVNPDTVAGLSLHTRVEPNTNDFFMKQDFLWWYEGKFFEYWLEKVKARTLAMQRVINTAAVRNTPYTAGAPTTVNVITNQGPYLDMTYFSEQNRYYGVATKSAWMQRSLTRGKRIKVTQKRVTYDNTSLCGWAVIYNGGPGTRFDLNATYPTDYFNYRSLSFAGLAAQCAAFGAILASRSGFAYALTSITDLNVAGQRQVRWNFTLGGVAQQGWWAPAPNSISDPVEFLDFANAVAVAMPIASCPIGAELYGLENVTQEDVSIAVEDVEYNTCVYKELGYTSISGHGHYTIAGAFVVDDATPEAPDYTDICLAGPTKRKKPQFNGIFIEPPWVNGSLCGRGSTATVNSSVYTFELDALVIPSGTILLQAGSIEPVYPTYLGAFVFDIQYKKWGKMRHDYKQLLDIYPINSQAGDGIIPYDSFLPRAGMLKADGFIAIFDQNPTDSEIVFGKLGYYRRGFTDLEEVRIQNRSPMSGTISFEASLDGKNVEPALSLSNTFVAATSVVAGFTCSARWYNVKVEGNYDLTAMEVRWHRTGRR